MSDTAIKVFALCIVIAICLAVAVLANRVIEQDCRERGGQVVTVGMRSGCIEPGPTPAPR